MQREDPNHNCLDSLNARNSALDAKLQEAMNQIQDLNKQMNDLHEIHKAEMLKV